jgi:hypothetical protein
MASWISADKESHFPNLTRDSYRKTSDATDKYNCAAWVVGDQLQWWQPPFPIKEPGHYWPEGAPKTLFISSFIKAYELCGFVRCDNSIEEGCQKIALYADVNGYFMHVAVQLPNGKWSSKLGEWEDIEHENLDALQGHYPAYGFVECWMKRTV